MQGNSAPIGFSSNSIIFLSDTVDLMPGVTNGVRQLLVQDIDSGARRLLSRSVTSGLPADADIFRAAVSRNERFVFFETASALTGTNSPGATEIYRCDLQDANKLLLVSVEADGKPSSIDCSLGGISTDGTRVSYSTSLGTETIFVKDLSGGVVTEITVPGLGQIIQPGSFAAGESTLSPDGRYLALNNLGNSPQARPGINWFDLATGTNRWCGEGLPAGFKVNALAPIMIFPDGRTIGFEGSISNSMQRMTFFWSADQGLMTFDSFLVTVPASSSNPGSAWNVQLSPDGNNVGFLSDSANVIVGLNDGLLHCYIRTLKTGATRIVDYGAPGFPHSLSIDADFSFTPDGTKLLLVSTPAGGASQVFAIGLDGSSTLLSASRGSDNRYGNLPLFVGPRSMSYDGRFRVYTSLAADLATEAANGLANVFIEDRLTRRSTLVSPGKAGAPASVGESFAPQVSLDGSKVLFLSSMTTTPVTGTPGSIHPHVFDLRSGTLEQVDPTGPANPKGYGVSSAALSKSGRFVSYLLAAPFSSFVQPMIKDLATGKSYALGNLQRLVGPPVISDDERTVVLNVGLGALSYSTADGHVLGSWNWRGFVPASLISVSQDGALIAGAFTQSTPLVQILDVGKGSISSFSVPATPKSIYSLTFAAKGESLLIEAGTSTDQPVRQIFSMEMGHGATALLTTNSAGLAANGISRSPSLSADGQWLAFVSDADDLVPGAGSHQPNVYRRDMTTGEIVLVSRTPDGSDTIGSSNASISDDGSTILFTSRDSRLAPAKSGSYAGLFAAESLRLAIRLVPSLPRAPLALSWDSESGVQYRLQYRDQALGGLWQDTSTLVTGDGSNVEINAPVDASNSQYFRIVEVQ